MDKIYGRKPALEALEAGVEVQRAFVLASGNPTVQKILDLLKEKNIETNFVERDFFDKIGGNNQGVLLEVPDFQYRDLEEVLSGERLVILDRLEDPHNLGAIIRSAEALGFDGVIIGKNRQVGVTPTVYKTSAGAVENMKVVQVTNISRTIERLKKEGFRIYGLAGEADASLHEADLTGKVCLVVGNEEKGLSKNVRDHCDLLLKIPMEGKVNSLNASVATAIALYEVKRQDGFK